MKKTKIIIPAMGMLLLGTAASVTGTVAWFSMNNSTTVTGMKVHTAVSSNLMIAEDTLGSTSIKADNQFGPSINTELDLALLEPVSTKNAKQFFYTTNALSTGDARADDYVAYNAAEVPSSSENTAFETAYSAVGAVGYKDYVFQLKAVNTQASNKDIKLTKLDLVYGGAQDASKAYRVAVFTEDLGEEGANPAGGSGELLGIYAPDGSSNFTANYAVGAAATAPTALSKNYNVVDNIATVPANKTNYYKVVVRLYLEGEDNTCNNTTFANLTENWSLRLELKIDGADSNTPVSSISKYTHAEIATVDTYYDGSAYLWTDVTKLGTESADRTAISAAADSTKETFGYTWAVSQSLTNATLTSGKKVIAKGNSADTVVGTYIPVSGYQLSGSTISVTIGGGAATAGTDYSFNESTGELTIKASKATGDITVSFSAASV